jgi:hypothetical protein
MARHTCPVCAYPDLDEPNTDVTGEPTYAICPCCGTQFGADDLVRSHDELRADWIAAGALWWSEVKAPPSGWNAAAQLAAAGITAAIPPVISG